MVSAKKINHNSDIENSLTIVPPQSAYYYSKREIKKYFKKYVNISKLIIKIKL